MYELENYLYMWPHTVGFSAEFHVRLNIMAFQLADRCLAAVFTTCMVIYTATAPKPSFGTTIQAVNVVGGLN